MNRQEETDAIHDRSEGLKGADLSGASLEGAGLCRVNLAEAIIHGARLAGKWSARREPEKSQLVSGGFGSIRAYLEKQGQPIAKHDMLIAAIARAQGLIVVTHNTREFDRIPGLNVEDWEVG